jgi:hypothetical protein
MRLMAVTALYARYNGSETAGTVPETSTMYRAFGIPLVEAETDKVAAVIMQSARKGGTQCSAASKEGPHVQL